MSKQKPVDPMFEDLSLTHLGSHSEDGVNAIDDVEATMREVARACADPMRHNSGSITLKIGVKASDGGGAVVLTTEVSKKLPGRRHRDTVAYVVPDGAVRTQKSEQLTLDALFPPKKKTEEPETSGEDGDGEKN